MKIVVGLGNPGGKYEESRHNVGFMAVDRLRQAEGLGGWQVKKKLKAAMVKAGDLLLVKPQTLMNDSGRVVKKVFQYYQFGREEYKDLYVVHDDLDIGLGGYKVQFGRGSAGHRGVQSIIDQLSSQDFWRVRIGIGQEPAIEAKEFVLSKFSAREKAVVGKTIDQAVDKIVKSNA